LTKCPVCAGRLRISELACDGCGTTLKSRFESCDFCRLPDEMYEFLRVFIKTRGSIKAMEKELGISYPTVRSRLDELQRLLGFQATDRAESAKETIAMLERGEISAEEAEEMLKGA
jgi:hypothetical protein